MKQNPMNQTIYIETECEIDLKNCSLCCSSLDEMNNWTFLESTRFKSLDWRKSLGGQLSAPHCSKGLFIYDAGHIQPIQDPSPLSARISIWAPSPLPPLNFAHLIIYSLCKIFTLKLNSHQSKWFFQIVNYLHDKFIFNLRYLRYCNQHT